MKNQRHFIHPYKWMSHQLESKSSCGKVFETDEGWHFIPVTKGYNKITCKDCLASEEWNQIIFELHLSFEGNVNGFVSHYMTSDLTF